MGVVLPGIMSVSLSLSLSASVSLSHTRTLSSLSHTHSITYSLTHSHTHSFSFPFQLKLCSISTSSAIAMALWPNCWARLVSGMRTPQVSATVPTSRVGGLLAYLNYRWVFVFLMPSAGYHLDILQERGNQGSSKPIKSTEVAR